MSAARHRLAPLLVLALAGCASTTAAPPPTPSSSASATTSSATTVSAAATPSTPTAADPCALLTADEVAGVFGAARPAVARPLGGSGWIEAQCEWTLPGATVSLAVGSTSSLATKGVSVPLAQYVADRRAAEAKQFPTADLEGVGDGGYLLVGRAPTALAYKGATLVQLIAFSPAGTVSAEVARSLIARATERATA